MNAQELYDWIDWKSFPPEPPEAVANWQGLTTDGFRVRVHYCSIPTGISIEGVMVGYCHDPTYAPARTAKAIQTYLRLGRFSMGRNGWKDWHG